VVVNFAVEKYQVLIVLNFLCCVWCKYSKII